MVRVGPTAKYADVDDVRRHNRYAPAMLLPSLTDSTTWEGLVNDEVTLVTTEVGVPTHEEATTKAEPSPETLMRPAPFTTTASALVDTGTTFGVRLLTATTLNGPAST